MSCLCHQVNSGHFQVAVYTSMMAHNVEAGLNAVLRNRNQLVAILDRYVCVCCCMSGVTYSAAFENA